MSDPIYQCQGVHVSRTLVPANDIYYWPIETTDQTKKPGWYCADCIGDLIAEIPYKVVSLFSYASGTYSPWPSTMSVLNIPASSPSGEYLCIRCDNYYPIRNERMEDVLFRVPSSNEWQCVDGVACEERSL